MRVFAILLLLTAPASAIDFSKHILGTAGESVCITEVKTIEECPKDKFYTLAVAARNALYAQYEDEKNLSGDEKYKRAELARLISAPGDVKLKPEDAALLKKLFGKAYGPLVVYQAWRILDGE